ncbi:hypothetical protein BROUX41_001669 [Berkeleyomyces rouxiae]|uniref:uncharacterized protein n=1 Tax=Berkeleyomyces rouxiae TaxID=2035830 RepID=UPI003B77105D
MSGTAVNNQQLERERRGSGAIPGGHVPREPKSGTSLHNCSSPDGSHSHHQAGPFKHHGRLSRSRLEGGQSGSARDRDRNRDRDRDRGRDSSKRRYRRESPSISEDIKSSAPSRMSHVFDPPALGFSDSTHQGASESSKRRYSRSRSTSRSRDGKDRRRDRDSNREHLASTSRHRSRSVDYGRHRSDRARAETSSAFRENHSPTIKRRRSRSPSPYSHRKRSKRERNRRDRDRDYNGDLDRNRDKNRGRDRSRDRDRDRDRHPARNKDRDYNDDSDNDARSSHRRRQNSLDSRQPRQSRSRSRSRPQPSNATNTTNSNSSKAGLFTLNTQRHRSVESDRRPRSRSKSPRGSRPALRKRSPSHSRDRDHDRDRDYNYDRNQDRTSRDGERDRRHDWLDDDDDIEHGGRKIRRERKRGKRPTPGDPFASGANSVEVNLAARLSRNDQSVPHVENDMSSSRSPLRGFSSLRHGPPKINADSYEPVATGLPSQDLLKGDPNSQISNSPPLLAPTGPSNRRNFRPASTAFRAGHSINDSQAIAPGVTDEAPRYEPHSNSRPNSSSTQPNRDEKSDQSYIQDPADGSASAHDSVAKHNDSVNGDSFPDNSNQASLLGPSSGHKFSFAFKPSKTSTTTVPKPEISQKFSASLATQLDKQASDGNPKNNDDGDRDAPPKNAPTGPASCRASRALHQQPRPPRTRKVTKKFRKLLPKPQLPEHLANSQSVYYRKPGNESVVGSGTYGKVFKAMNVYTNNLVALKKIRMEGERDGFPVTAMREIKLLQYLRHTNVVSLLEVMVEKNECFMVFEYLSHDLTGILNHPSFKLDKAQKKNMSKQMFEGLEYLHARGVLHRDIKAANILVSKDGVLKLADFGLARFYAKRHRLDYTNRVITIWYRPPELLLGETKYSAMVDVWSAACVMVEIFCRQPIFPGDGTESNQLERIFSVMGTPTKENWPGITKLPWFQLLRPNVLKPCVFDGKYCDRVSPHALQLLASMFQYDPDRRPSATDVLNHPYFTNEEPAPVQCTELQYLDGDWHEFDSKALRREARRARGHESDFTADAVKVATKANPNCNLATSEASTFVDKSAMPVAIQDAVDTMGSGFNPITTNDAPPADTVIPDADVDVMAVKDPETTETTNKTQFGLKPPPAELDTGSKTYTGESMPLPDRSNPSSNITSLASQTDAALQSHHGNSDLTIVPETNVEPLVSNPMETMCTGNGELKAI